MTTINRLSAVDTLQGGDQVPVYDQSNGDARKASMTVLQDFILSNFIANLTQSTNAIVSGDLVPVYDLSANQSYKFDVNLLRNFIRENIFGGMTAGTDVALADLLAIYDDSAGAVRSVSGTLLRNFIRDNIFGGITAATEVTDADLFAIFEDTAGATRSVTAAMIAAYIQKNYFSMQYASPSATGFSVAITNGSANVHLVLTPTAGFAAGTIVLPAIANVVDQQEVLVNCTQQVTTLTIDGNGAGSVTGEPSSLGADDFFKLKYDATTDAWYRIG